MHELRLYTHWAGRCLVATLLPLVLTAAAQAQAPSVAGEWSGSETLGGYGALRFRFSSGGVTMIDVKDKVSGIMSITGNKVRLAFWNASVVYNGTINGNTMSGSATNGRTNWSWSVSRPTPAAPNNGGGGLFFDDNAPKPGKTPTADKKTPKLTAKASAEKAWKKHADEAAQNLKDDKVLSDALRDAGAKSKTISEKDLRVIVSIESSADRDTGKNKFGYAGLFQIGKAAAKDTGFNYKDLDEPKEWRTNLTAGVKYLEKNAATLQRKGIDPSLLNIYMAHQQGPTGAQTIISAVSNGTARTMAANANQLANLPRSYKDGIFHSGRMVSVQDYYDYLAETVRTIDSKVNPPLSLPVDPGVRMIP